jgi:hypothetical protein
VAESADAADSKSAARKSMGVQVPSAAPIFIAILRKYKKGKKRTKNGQKFVRMENKKIILCLQSGLLGPLFCYPNPQLFFIC